MKLLVATVSAIALGAVPVFAQGNGNGQRGGPPAHAGPSADRAGNGNTARGNGRGTPETHNERRNAPQVRERGNRTGPPVTRGNGNAANRAAAITIGNGDDRDFDFRSVTGTIAEGCPPGLARKYNGCRPPGIARQQDHADRLRHSADWWGLGDIFGGPRGDLLYDDGFLLRLGDDGLISGYVPLLGGALSIGNLWPDDYRYSTLPTYYENYYGLGRDDFYRYADNVVYRLNPETTAITSIAALLTGDEFVVGQPMPSGYDVYNVPYSYRDRYYDRPDAMYRYNNGYVYEIDPETMLVASAIELLI